MRTLVLLAVLLALPASAASPTKSVHTGMCSACGEWVPIFAAPDAPGRECAARKPEWVPQR